jgi:riboflavin biosynthesis pyrimidine reductase
MKARVVNTIYLTIEPIMFGKGISLLNEEMHNHLILKNVERAPDSDTVMLEYSVQFGGPAV